MLCHKFLRVGENISLQNILLPPLIFCSVCLFILFFIACCQHEQSKGWQQRKSAWAYSLKWFQGGKESLRVLLENLQVLLIGNIQFWEIFQVKTLFQKMCPLLYKRAKLDLRLTTSFRGLYLLHQTDQTTYKMCN